MIKVIENPVDFCLLNSAIIFLLLDTDDSRDSE